MCRYITSTHFYELNNPTMKTTEFEGQISVGLTHIMMFRQIPRTSNSHIVLKILEDRAEDDATNDTINSLKKTVANMN